LILLCTHVSNIFIDHKKKKKDRRIRDGFNLPSSQCRQHERTNSTNQYIIYELLTLKDGKMHLFTAAMQS
jgi:hypothetical protein